jgi:hypothetical protein
MYNFIRLPLVFLKFWYFDAFFEIIRYFSSINSAFFQLFSLPLFLKTYFKPLKNEYREGLVGFSIGMGMFVKSFLIIANLVIFTVMLIIEFVVVFSFFAFPIATVGLLFL